MATPTAVAPARPAHRAARLSDGHPFLGTLALDWNNGQVITTGAGVSAASSVFDANNDRIVYVSTDTTPTWITVGPATPVAVTAGAGNMVLTATMPAQPIYVPLNMEIAAIGATAHVSCIPALIGTGG